MSVRQSNPAELNLYYDFGRADKESGIDELESASTDLIMTLM